MADGTEQDGGQGNGGAGDALLNFGGAGDGGSQQQQQQQPAGQSQTQGQPQGRFIDFGGERIEVPPELWDDKSGQVNVAAAVKRSIDLRRQMGTLPKAPDEYKLALPDALKGKIEFDPATDVRFKAASAWGKKNNVSQAAMEELAGIHWSAESSVVDGDVQSRQAEMTTLLSALGGDTGTPEERQGRATKEMGETARWARDALATGKDGKLIPDRVATLQRLASTADGVMMLRDLRGMMTEAPIPGVKDEVQGALTKEGLESMMKDPRYKSDPAFAQKVHDGFRRLFGE